MATVVSRSNSSSKTVDQNIWDKKVAVQESGYYWNGTPVLFSAGDPKALKRPIVVELFCGCGGTSKGFEMAGYDIALGLDIHSPSVKTFSKNHPKAITVLGDIKKISPEFVTTLLKGLQVDVLIGGVPCQGFSLNNRKRHENDKRNFLYREFIKYIKVLKPKVAIIENVSGMVSTANGKFVEQIEKDISEAGDMLVSSKLLCTADFGVPQMRRRLLFIGVRGDKKFNFETDLKKTHGPGTKNPYVTIREAIGDLPSLSGGELSEAYARPATSAYQKLMRANSGDTVFNHRAPKHPAATIRKIKNTKPGEPMYSKFKQRIRLHWDIQSPTQVSGGIRPQFQFGHPQDARGLTIRERCRLQSFPDDFIVEGGIVQGRVQTGNAVAPLFARAIALALKKYV